MPIFRINKKSSSVALLTTAKLAKTAATTRTTTTTTTTKNKAKYQNKKPKFTRTMIQSLQAATRSTQMLFDATKFTNFQ